MKITKAVHLLFSGTNVAFANVVVPFVVSNVHVKGLGYDPQNNPVSGTAQYGVISSDLVDNQPLAIFYNDATYSFTSNKDIQLTLYTPRTINGTFQFNLINDAGNPYTPTGGGNDRVILILEFNDDTEK